MNVEAALLTGGASRRMGTDKARLVVDGRPQARRTADALLTLGIPVTVLGREPLDGCDFVGDREELAGPVAALAQFLPTVELVFVCSCDIPLFDGRLVEVLMERIEDRDAAAPEVNGWRQPLCALYRHSAWNKLPDLLRVEDACAMHWLDALDHTVVSSDVLAKRGLDPRSAQGANTELELAELLGKFAGKSFESLEKVSDEQYRSP